MSTNITEEHRLAFDALSLLDIFGTAPRVLAARPDRLRTMPGLSEDAIAAIKTAEALGIRMAREDVPEPVRYSFASRALALGETLPVIGKLLGHSDSRPINLTRAKL